MTESRISPTAEQAAAAFEVRGLRAAYVHNEILRGVTLSIPSGGVAGVIGANGSGKSTLLRTIAGQIPRASGSVRLNGSSLLGLPTQKIATHGVRFLFQNSATFPNLTVEENLAVAGIGPGVDGEVYRRFPTLRPLRRKRAGLLSGGEARILALALIFRPGAQLLLLDEPSAGIAGTLAKHLLDAVLLWAKEQGATVLLVEQNLRIVATVATRIYALANGVATEVPSSEIADPLQLAQRLLTPTPATLNERSPS